MRAEAHKARAAISQNKSKRVYYEWWVILIVSVMVGSIILIDDGFNQELMSVVGEAISVGKIMLKHGLD